LQAHQERAYCAANFLSAGTLAMIDGMRQQLLGELTGRRLVRSLGDASSAAGDAGLVRCVLVSRTACWPVCHRQPGRRIAEHHVRRTTASLQYVMPALVRMVLQSMLLSHGTQCSCCQTLTVLAPVGVGLCHDCRRVEGCRWQVSTL
jgi:hypothetical protein